MLDTNIFRSPSNSNVSSANTRNCRRSLSTTVCTQHTRNSDALCPRHEFCPVTIWLFVVRTTVPAVIRSHWVIVRRAVRHATQWSSTIRAKSNWPRAVRCRVCQRYCIQWASRNYPCKWWTGFYADDNDFNLYQIEFNRVLVYLLVCVYSCICRNSQPVLITKPLSLAGMSLEDRLLSYDWKLQFESFQSATRGGSFRTVCLDAQNNVMKVSKAKTFAVCLSLFFMFC